MGEANGLRRETMRVCWSLGRRPARVPSLRHERARCRHAREFVLALYALHHVCSDGSKGSHDLISDTKNRNICMKSSGFFASRDTAVRPSGTSACRWIINGTVNCIILDTMYIPNT
ncbi:hypothetical protein EVAR_39144_1 [Eumeta japonica]|uniref:Uncharacterized protein n=1 Tax=Eumeta variegata TaxID=151549 RepID=A0A4C1X9M2_EUMVA|nr:hypothetical protein EVAR_39144_1 [Eumeta japonica]